MGAERTVGVNVLLTLLVLCIGGCMTGVTLTTDKACMPPQQERTDSGLYLIATPDMRFKEPDTYFGKERAVITKRRTHFKLPHPESTALGLALSGGGIRSNAFQLGLLSGMHRTDLLKNVDYISAVSGGSWAAGAYKSTLKSDSTFFEELNAVVTRDDLATNDSRMHPLFNSYDAAIQQMLKVKKDYFYLHVGNSSQEAWRKMIKINVLNNHDPLIEELNSGNGAVRPYLIFNATHDGKFSFFNSEANNFPFEITTDYLGSTADCGNTTYCSFYNSNSDIGCFAPTTDKNVPPLFLSHAMAISGAVVPQKVFGINLNLMEWIIDLPDAPAGPRCRDHVKLTDGGHAENLGALALIERHVPLIIISDAAYDPAQTFGDLTVLQQHADKLLGVALEKIAEKSAVRRYRYFSKSTPAESIGTIIYLKANSDNNAFEDFLLDANEEWHGMWNGASKNGLYNLYTYLETTKQVTDIGFPADKTYATDYDYRLIFSYYMLGHYFGTKVLPKEFPREDTGD